MRVRCTWRCTCVACGTALRAVELCSACTRHGHLPSACSRGAPVRCAHASVMGITTLTPSYPTLPYATPRYPTLPYATLPCTTLPYATLRYPTPRPSPSGPYPDSADGPGHGAIPEEQGDPAQGASLAPRHRTLPPRATTAWAAHGGWRSWPCRSSPPLAGLLGLRSQRPYPGCTWDTRRSRYRAHREAAAAQGREPADPLTRRRRTRVRRPVLNRLTYLQAGLARRDAGEAKERDVASGERAVRRAGQQQAQHGSRVRAPPLAVLLLREGGATCCGSGQLGTPRKRPSH